MIAGLAGLRKAEPLGYTPWLGKPQRRGMNKSDLTKKIHNEVSRSFFLRQDDIKEAVEQILLFLADKLAAGERIEIRDFGVLYTKLIPPRIGRNPKTGESVDVPPRIRPKFKAGKELRESVDREN